MSSYFEQQYGTASKFVVCFCCCYCCCLLGPMSVGPGPGRLTFNRGGGVGDSPSLPSDTGYLPCYLLGSNSSNNVKIVNNLYRKPTCSFHLDIP